MPHELDVLVRGSEVAKGRVEGAHGSPFNAPGQRQDLAGGPVVPVPELEPEQVVSILSQIAEQVELLIEVPSGRQMPRCRMGVVDDEHWENPCDRMAREPGANELPVGRPPVGRVTGGVHADESEGPLADPALDDRTLLVRPVGLADGEEHQQLCPLEVRDRQIRHLRNMAEAQPVQLRDLRRCGHCRRQAVVDSGQAGRAGGIPVGGDIRDEYERAHEGITATTLISTRMFFSAAPVVARAG